MQLKEKFVVTELGNDYIAVPVGGETDGFRGVVRLNETGAEILKGLSTGLNIDQIADKLVAEYEGVNLTRARAAVRKIVDQLLVKGLIED